MRIPKFVAAVATISLACGASLSAGLSAAADSAPGWDVSVYADLLDPITITGTMPEGTSGVEVTVEVPIANTGYTQEGEASCDWYTTSFDCSYVPGDTLGSGSGTVSFFNDDEVGFSVDFWVPTVASGPPVINAPTMIPAGIVTSVSLTAPATKAATTFFRYADSSWYPIDGACPFPESDPIDNSCTIEDLAAGIYLYSVEQDNGDGSTPLGDFDSRFFVIPATPEISGVVAPGNRVELSGTFPLEPLSSSIQVPSQCESNFVDYEAGTWECTTESLTPGQYSFTVLAIADADADNYDVGEGAPPYDPFGQSAETTTTIRVGLPVVEYGDFVPGGATITGIPQEPAGLVAIGVDGFDWWGDPYIVQTCPDYDTEYGEPNACTVADLYPGSYYSYAQQDDGEDSFPDVFTYDYFTVPDAPEIAWFIHNSNGTVTFHGYAWDSFEITIVSGDAQDVVPCAVTFVDEGWDLSWTCTTTEPFAVGDYSFGAYATDAAASSLGYDSELSDEGMVYHAGGKSPISYPGMPVVAYHPVPGGIYVDAYATGLGTVVRVDLFSFDGEESEDWQDNCGGISLPEFYDWEYYEEELSIFDGISSGEPGHNFGCLFENLNESDGHVWAIETQQDDGDGWYPSDSTYDYFYLPDAPLITGATAHANKTVTLAGNAHPGFLVHIIDENKNLLCSTYPSAEDDDTYGDWTCTTPSLVSGPHQFRAYAEDTEEAQTGDQNFEFDCECWYPTYRWGGLSALSESEPATVPVVLPPAGGSPPQAPGATLITPSWVFTLTGLDFGNMHPGDTFTISGSGLPPGAKISAELHSTPVSLGQATVGSDGKFTLTSKVPENAEPGDHTIVVTLTGDGLAPTTHQQAVTVSASEEAGQVGQGGGVAEAPHGEVTDDGHGDEDSSATAPNILTNSMNPILEVLSDPGRIPAAFAAGLVLIIFAIVPAHLLNSTVAEQYERLTRRMPRLKTAPPWYTGVTKAFAKAPALGGIALMAATGFLFALADPHFGLNLHSLRLIIALSGALFVVFFVANAITGAIMRRAWNVDVVVKLRPFGLVLTIAGVIVSRMLEFSPGFLIGIVLGLSIATSAAAEQAWKAVLVRTSVIVTFGIASWIVYSSIAEGVHHDPTFLNEVVLEFFVAIATEGIVLLLVELLPLHLLEGERVFKRSRVLWAAIYVVVLAMFILAVVPWAGNWRELGESFWPWFTTVAIFGASCVAVYLFFRFIAPPPHHGDHVGELEDDNEDDERIAVGNDS